MTFQTTWQIAMALIDAQGRDGAPDLPVLQAKALDKDWEDKLNGTWKRLTRGIKPRRQGV